MKRNEPSKAAIAVLCAAGMLAGIAPAYAYHWASGDRTFGIIENPPASYSFSLDPDGNGMCAYSEAHDGGSGVGYFNRYGSIVPDSGDLARVAPVAVTWNVQFFQTNPEAASMRGAGDIDFLDGTYRFFEVVEGAGASQSYSQTVVLNTNTRYIFEIDSATNAGSSTGVLAQNVGCAQLAFPPEVVDAPPTVGDISVSAQTVAAGTAVSATASFGYPDVGQSFSASFDWGDGSSGAGDATASQGTGQASATHVYTSPGVYAVTLTVTDSQGLGSTSTFEYVVVYDATAGFVTGGGWLASPPGAYAADPTLTGMASFGFVAKYQKGASVPTGNTHFSFAVASMKFESTSYDWLVVSGSKATYKGTGTINGSGSYGFMLSAIDGDLGGGSAPDALRLKIVDGNGNVVYDNQMGADDNGDPSTAIGGGSIVIHR